MFSKVEFLIIGFIVNCAHGALDWCDPVLCPNGVKHTACNNTGEFHESCAADTVMIDLTPYRDLILHEHNKRRNFIANGLLPGFYPASRMATIQWDEELEFLADLNVRTCVVDHDECKNSYRFRNVGQNLVGIARRKQERQIISEIIMKDLWLWYAEHKMINSDFITKFKVNMNFEKYGHFAEFVLDRNTHVGCAMIRYTPREYPHAYIYNMACNYASIFALDVPVYLAGQPGSACKTGTNTKYPALCSTREVYNPNY
ncbi:antigen 5 like allergen Cul n 1-like [Stomoxys calcitrans]|uniref:Venom allergen-1 n=1 Tax=Stomoxys calcitrans TaxID=35570 RepID=A0A1I8Q0Y8_STOCA|nr:antigen 5 like allergen Cul n 1-like [Stomoxys calcitrans]